MTDVKNCGECVSVWSTQVKNRWHIRTAQEGDTLYAICDSEDKADFVAAALNACRGFDPREMRMKAIAWDVINAGLDVMSGYHADNNLVFAFIYKGKRIETEGQTKYECTCRAAIAAGIINEEDLQ